MSLLFLFCCFLIVWVLVLLFFSLENPWFEMQAPVREEGEGLRPRRGPRGKGSRDQLGSGSGVGFESAPEALPAGCG